MSEVKVQDYTNVMQSLPRLEKLPALLPLEGAVRIELEEGVPVFRASDVIQARIEDLVMKQGNGELSPGEEKELDRYEEIDDYLSFVNRVVRNLTQTK
jgi:hypothetical protein